MWRAGRIRNLVKNPVYRGELQYGRRSARPDGREVIAAEIPPLVSRDIWEAAQLTLSGNRLMAKNTKRNYLLKSVIRCGISGHAYIGSWSRNAVRYRCNGQLTDRGPIPERCPAKAIRGPDIDAVVDDIERFLREPGDILEELAQERTMDAGAAIAEAERLTLESAMVDLAGRRKKAIDLYTRDQISDAELDELLAEIGRERDGVAKRLDELQEAASEPQEPLDPDLLEQVRRRLNEGLNDTQRQEVVRLLVKRITVHTAVEPEGKVVRVLIEYRFPGVVNDFTDIRGELNYKPNSAIYQWHAYRRQALVEQAWRESGLLVHQQIIWAKARGVLTHSHYLWAHEPCFYGWVEGHQPSKKPPASERTIWQLDQQGSSMNIHPTQKPLELFLRPIEYHTEVGDLCYEPFLGSGTQLIAAEKLGRVCYAMEREPQYVDVAVKRWESFTGERAVKENQ